MVSVQLMNIWELDTSTNTWNSWIQIVKNLLTSNFDNLVFFKNLTNHRKNSEIFTFARITFWNMAEIAKYQKKFENYLFQTLILALPKIYANHLRGCFFKRFFNQKSRFEVLINTFQNPMDTLYKISLKTKGGYIISSKWN